MRALLTTIAILAPVNAWADDPTGADAWFAYYADRAANDYELAWTEAAKPLGLRRESILNWTNPLEEGRINGSTFVWESDGRPIVVGQLFSYEIGNDRRNLCHVFASLTDEPVLARRNETEIWSPAGTKTSSWHVAKGIAKPAPRAAARLIQMRSIARRFEAHTEEATRGRRDLRFLPQPLHRFGSDKAGFDGGVFAYVVGNDPELLVVVEGVLTGDGAGWRYRFAQSTRSTTVATLEETEVYRYEHDDRNPTRTPYLSVHGIEVIPTTLESRD